MTTPCPHWCDQPTEDCANGCHATNTVSVPGFWGDKSIDIELTSDSAEEGLAISLTGDAKFFTIDQATLLAHHLLRLIDAAITTPESND